MKTLITAVIFGLFSVQVAVTAQAAPQVAGGTGDCIMQPVAV